jgi:hypothetical protein
MISYAQAITQSVNYWDRKDQATGYFYIGRKDNNDRDCAIRFTGVTIPQGTTITSATISVAADTVSGSSKIDLNLLGIDEDNTADFSSNPENRTKTDAKVYVWDNLPSQGQWLNINVTSIVQEIVNRGGWVSGNAMGFWIFKDVDTENGVYIYDANDAFIGPCYTNTKLYIEASSASPSPSSSPSPSPSIASKHIIRVALPGYNALTDTNPDHFALYSDEDWVLIKEKMRGSVSVGAFSSETITHNLGYVPFYAVYADREWVSGYNIYSSYRVYATTTTLVISNTSASAKTFAYYLFYDRQL